MEMAIRTKRWTRGDLARLPDDGNRYEVLDGELFVTPQAAHDHQRVALLLAMALEPWCVAHGLGYVVGPGALIWRQNELQPDVQVVPGRYEDLAGQEWKELPRPLLVAEVLSDSTQRRDLGKKREAYQRVGIPTYWVVDIDERRVLAWTLASPEPVVVTEVLVWRPKADVPALEIPLASILPKARG